MPRASQVNPIKSTVVSEYRDKGSLAGLCQKIGLKPTLPIPEILDGFGLNPEHPWAGLANQPQLKYYPWLFNLVQEESPSWILKIGSGLDLDEAPLLQARPGFELFIRLDDQEGRRDIFGQKWFEDPTPELIHHWCENKLISPEKARFYQADTGPVGDANRIQPWYLVPDLLRLLRGHEFDLVFIDGQPSLKHIENALDIFWPYTAPGGLVVCGFGREYAEGRSDFLDPSEKLPGLGGFIGREARSIQDYHLEEIIWRANGGPGSARAFGLIRKRPSFHELSPKRVVFDQPGSLEINRARIDHLLSLGLPLANKSVLEVGAGVGYLTEPFEKMGCRVVSTDARAENCLENLRRHPRRTVEVLDLNISGSHKSLGRFDIVFCYGTLYHLSNPDRCLADLADQCQEIFLLETCVAPRDNGRINPISENHKALDQSYDGTGCRPGRDWIMSELGKHFPYVYHTVTQPDHPDYPIEWPARLDPPRVFLTRSVFVASRRPLTSDALSRVLISSQSDCPR